MITKPSPEEVRERRSYYLNKSKKVTKINKGDKRVSGTRICAVCKTQLSTVILRDGSTVSTRAHYHCYFSEFLYINICRDSSNCQRIMKNTKED